MEVARYTVGCSIVFPKGEIARFDGQLKSLEAKMKASSERMKGLFNLRLNSFSVNQRGLDKVLGNALDIASNRTVFHIENFVVDQTRLNRALTAAMVRATAFTDAGITIKSPRREGSGKGLSGTSKAAATGGMIGGGLSRFYGPALALGLGGYGLGSLNKRNQEVVAAQLQTQAVSLANGGTAQQGEESFNWLRNQANRVGFNYLDASSDFNVLTSNLLGSGGTVAQSRNIFKGFAEYGRVNKLTPARQKLVFNALSQIAGKDKLQAEELTKQLGNSLPGAKDIFAQAYQQQTGGNLKGSAAIIALEAAMKAGTVRGNILDVAATIASQRAAPGLSKASQASQAEQARYQNAVSDTAILASNSGVEEGFARIFRTLTAGLSESNGLVRTLAEGFNEATKWADDLLLFPQSFVRALEGKDSLVADWLGADQTAQLIQDWKDIKALWAEIAAIKPTDLFGNFLPTIQATAREIAGILDLVGKFKNWNDNASAAADITQAEITQRGSPLGDTFSSFAGSLAGAYTYLATPFGVDESSQYKDYKAEQFPAGVQSMQDREQLKNIQNTFEFSIALNIDPVVASQMDVKAQADALTFEFTEMLRASLSNASVNFPQKE